MNWSAKVTRTLEALLDFSVHHALIEEVDRPYFRNLLLDVMGMDAPDGEYEASAQVASTATALLTELCDLAVEKELIEDLGYARDLFSARVMGLMTPSPREVRNTFLGLVNEGKAEEATEYFYNMCRVCDYIKVDAIAQNVRYFADSPAGELEITINLS